MTTATVESVVATRELTAADRCDSCGAQAYVRATLATGDLLFCAHHATKFRDKLMPTAVHWHDETAKLLAATGA